MPLGKAKPAPYSPTDHSENEAIHLFECKIDRRHVKTDIKSRDKFPNFDGYIEIVDDGSHSIGKLELQVKSIGKDSKHYYCEISSLAYSKTTTLPILLILVDIPNQIVYWKHLIEGNARLSDKGKSYIFDLTSSDVINEENNYLNQWIVITEEYKKRIAEFSKIETMIKLSSYSIKPKNISPEAIRYFQEFIDTLNIAIDKEYPAIKEKMFPNLWKIGVSVCKYSDQLAFGLYGIPLGTSDLIVKELDESFQSNLFSKSFLQSFASTKVEESASRLAYDFVFGYLDTLISNKAFMPVGKILSEEYVYSVVKDCYSMFGLQKSSQYSVSAIMYGMTVILPVWISVAMEMPWFPHHMRGVDIIFLSHFPHEEVDRRVQSILTGKERHSIKDSIYFNSYDFDFYQFITCLNYLKANNIENVSTLLVDPDYSLVKDKKSFYISEPYTNEGVRRLCFGFFQNTNDALLEFLNIHKFPSYFFPSLDHMQFIIPSISDHLDSFMPVNITILEVEKNAAFQGDKNIVVILDSDKDWEKDLWKSLNNGFEYQGHSFKVVSWSSTIDIEIFEKRPFYSYVYKYIEKIVKKGKKEFGTDGK